MGVKFGEPVKEYWWRPGWGANEVAGEGGDKQVTLVIDKAERHRLLTTPSLSLGLTYPTYLTYSRFSPVLIYR